MIIEYNPNNRRILKGRKKEAERIFNKLPYRYCFISGSFLFKKNYKDIDVFVITRSKKRIKLENKKMNVQIIDFNNLSSLFYHSVKKSCLAKNILPERELKVSVSEYWEIINETMADIKNKKMNFSKEIRALILYTFYLNTNKVMDSFDLIKASNRLNTIKKVEDYIKKNAPTGISKNVNQSYIERFFYTAASQYKDLFEYAGMKDMYNLTHLIIKNGNPHTI